MPETKVGRLIVIEGASDGIGKTTQYNLLKEHCKADKIKIATHHFPTYYSYQGECATRYLAGDFGKPDELSPYFINNVYAIDRAITWRIKLQKECQKGRTILLDRYTTSSLIYQSAFFEDVAEKTHFLDYIIDFEYNKLGTRAPDDVIFLYAPLELVNKIRQERTTNDGIANDIHECDLAYLSKVYDNAMFVANYLGWTMINCATTSSNKMRAPEDIHKEIYQKLNLGPQN